MTSAYPYEFGSLLEGIVVGQKIVAADGDKITLSNGTTVRLTGSSDCCAWGSVDVLAASLVDTDHVITSVKEKDTTDPNERYTDQASWFIMADHQKVLQIDGEWDPSSGYYFYGFYVDVVPA